jgi:replicative DNA helicase
LCEGERGDWTVKTLPHSPDAERALLGAILLDNTAFEQARVLGVTDFFLPAHRTIWNAICELFAKSAPVDSVTLAEELSRREQLEGIGGAVYLSSLTDGLPKSSNIEHYVKIVREKATRRRLIGFCDSITRRAEDQAEDIDGLMESAQGLLRTRLVHLLDHLEGQNDIANLAGLAVPDQFHFALVLKQQKAVLVRQGLVGFDVTDNFLLFLFG